MSGLRRLISEIHRRSLWQVLAIYLVASWVVFQVIQTLTEGLGLPEWFPAFAVILLLIGLPIVLATAFVQEGGPAARRQEPTLSAGAEAEPEPASREAQGLGRLFTWRNAITGGVLALALWGVIATGWLLSHSGAAAVSPEERKSVAVLPFANIGGDPENEYFSDGITGDIIAHLGKIADLKVISRTSVMQYKYTQKNLRVIGEELGVAAILEGEMQRAGDRLRINAQLVDAETDEHLWAETYDRQLTDIFAIQSDVAQRIAAALEATLSPEERDQIEREPTESLEAYHLYLKGRFFWSRRTEDGLRRAIEYFEQALELDRSYALAYSGLADAYSVLGYWYGRPRDVYPKAKAAAARALESDDALAAAHVSMAFLLHMYDWDFAAAEDEYRRAIEINPGNAQGRAWYCILLTDQGRFDDAREQHSRAEELDPLSPVVQLIGVYRTIFAGDPDATLEYTRSMLDLVPDFWQAYMGRSWAFRLKDMWEEAIAEGRKAAIQTGGAPWALVVLGEAYAEAGRREEAEELVGQMESRYDESYFPPSLIARVYAGLGEVNTAFEWLEQAYDEGDVHITNLKVNPTFHGLRSDPRYTDLLRRIGLE